MDINMVESFASLSDETHRAAERLESFQNFHRA